MQDPYAVDLTACRGRQQRLMEVMRRERLDLAIIARGEHIQWLTGVRYPHHFEPVVTLSVDGRCGLIVPNKAPETAAADDVRTYEGKWLSTMRNDQRAAAAAVLADVLATESSSLRVGGEYSVFGPHLREAVGCDAVFDVEPEIVRMRRRKDDDELALIGRAIDATGAMYRRAREIIRPGINELDVFNELQAVAVRELGEMLTGTGNDYACGARGGPPRDREAQSGELYILDLGPAYRGYYADNCRAIAVDGRPTDLQAATNRCICEVFGMIEAKVRPGVRCREVFDEAKAMLDAYMPDRFNHHLGHGIGLSPHEGPHLNPNWDDVFSERDVFTVEPGLYGDDLRGGIRLENDYLVTSDGVELLTDFPLEL
ncbi:MAG: aminopeptidase P family protein [Planctomycetales bacterium]|nr:aminopeptidase P family protein [Planctomycetales bacterium]